MKKKIRLLFSLLLVVQLFPISPIFAETVQDVPVGETTISSKAEDPLKEYKDKAQNQVPTVESTVSQDVPGVEKEAETSPEEIEKQLGESPTPTNDSIEEQEITNQRIEPRGGIVPLAGTTLVEGLPGDPFPYDIDKNFANAIRSIYPTAPDPMTDDFMESLTVLNVSNRGLTSLKGIEFAINLTELECNKNSLNSLDISGNIALMKLDCSENNIGYLDVSQCMELIELRCFYNSLSGLNLNANTKLKFLYCSNNNLASYSFNVITNTELEVLDCSNNRNLNHLDVTQNLKLRDLWVVGNSMSTLNVSQNTLLERMNCGSNPLGNLDLSNNPSLTFLHCNYNQLTDLDVSNNQLLETFYCVSNQLNTIDVSQNLLLKEFNCSDNPLGTIDVSQNLQLEMFSCQMNQLTSLDITNNTALKELYCNINELTNLDVSQNVLLETLFCYDNRLNDLDINSNSNLNILYCYTNQLTSLDISQNPALKTLYCYNNQLGSLDLSQSPLLETLFCQNNDLTNLDVSNNLQLIQFNCSNNQIGILDVSRNANLTTLNCQNNRISDITSAFGLSNLTNFNASGQELKMRLPAIINNQLDVDILKTTAQGGLSSTNIDVSPAPTISINGDEVKLTNVIRGDLLDKSIAFSYDGTQLTEGATTGTKSFSGSIMFYSASDLGNKLEPNVKKVNTGCVVQWTWKITSLTDIDAKNISASLNLPVGLVIDGSSIEKDGIPATMSDIDGTNNLGDLSQNQEIIFTFKTTATGNAEEWLKPTGELRWSDNTIHSPYMDSKEGAVQILDEEQTDTSKEGNDLALLSAPIQFNYGIRSIENTGQTYNLHPDDYQTNTNVSTKGFYTRVKDDQVVSTGWKLTASLSEFKDSVGRQMPNGAGTSLRLENMFIQKVNDRDTPQEALDPSATGGPSTIQTDETLVAGQTAKTLVSAQVGEGQGTWQLQMPFDDISLILPAGAGKSNTDYKAKLTWSLNNTP